MFNDGLFWALTLQKTQLHSNTNAHMKKVNHSRLSTCITPLLALRRAVLRTLHSHWFSTSPPPIALIGHNALYSSYQVLSEELVLDHAVPPQTCVGPCSSTSNLKCQSRTHILLNCCVILHDLPFVKHSNSCCNMESSYLRTMRHLSTLRFEGM